MFLRLESNVESIFDCRGWASRYFIFSIMNLINVHMFQTTIEVNDKTLFYAHTMVEKGTMHKQDLLRSEGLKRKGRSVGG